MAHSIKKNTIPKRHRYQKLNQYTKNGREKGKKGHQRNTKTYSEVGKPTSPKNPICRTCKSKISSSGMCVCSISNHTDLSGYKLTKDIRVRYSDEDSENSIQTIFGITNKAAKAVLGGTLHIETTDSNAAYRTGISQV